MTGWYDATALAGRRPPGTGRPGPGGLGAQRSTHHDVEGRPRRTLAQCVEEFTTCSLPARELVARIPAPRRDHGKSKDSAVKEQFRISARVALADIFGDVGEVELDGPAAARLEIDEQQAGLRAEHVARVRL